MRDEPQWLASLLHQVYEGEPGSDDGWHGPSLRRLLGDLSWEQARARPIPGGHTIWELVLHIAVWDEICARRLAGDEILTTTGSAGDWPAVERDDEESWHAARRRLAAAQETLLASVRALSDADLERTVAGWPWTYRWMLHGTLHHDLYHAGQIALLRRACRPG